MIVPNTYLLTGLPRAGTTLCCHILNSHPNTLALHEPLSPEDFNPILGKEHALAQITEFALATRSSVVEKGMAQSRHKNGEVPDNPVALTAAAGSLRAMDVTLGEIDVGHRGLQQNFNLIIKHNALFTALLPELAVQFPVYGIVRNPLAVLASWNSVDLPVNTGHIPAGEKFCPELRQKLASLPDKFDRQLCILEWFCARFIVSLPNRVLRYEEFVERPELVANIMQLYGVNQQHQSARQSRNQHYDLALMESLYAKLKHYGEAIWHFYTADQVDELMESIRKSA